MMKGLLNDKRGDALIWGIVLTIVCMAVFYAMLLKNETQTVADHVRSTSIAVLDDYTIEAGKEYVQSVKNGTDYTFNVDLEVYKQQFQERLGVNSEFEGYRGSRIRFQITNMGMGYTTDKTFKTYVTYTINMPLYLLDKQILTIPLPITVQSRYNLK